MSRKIQIILGATGLVLALGGLIVLHLFFEKAPKSPFITGWFVASMNFLAAVLLFQKAQHAEFKVSMILVFGGSGIRMLIMLITIINSINVKPVFV